MSKLSQLEAILFIVGDEGIGLEELSYLLEEATPKIYQYIQTLNQRYQENNDAALNILEVGNHFILTTKKRICPAIKEICAVTYV
jgi:segregation and condensation protein B